METKPLTFAEVVYQLRDDADSRQRAVVDDVLAAIEAARRARRSLTGLHTTHRLAEPEPYLRDHYADRVYQPLAGELVRALRSAADKIEALGKPASFDDDQARVEFQPQPVPATALLSLRLDAAEHRLQRLAQALKAEFPDKFATAADLGFADDDLDGKDRPAVMTTAPANLAYWQKRREREERAERHALLQWIADCAKWHADNGQAAAGLASILRELHANGVEPRPQID
ncbi:MAG TPA: hypothetical protein VFQ80_08990 [Thermomicrobiales bacterium]|jgi:hypothetical protein|nr:hypothetical protein [Thermomicrobiales bacterium]